MNVLIGYHNTPGKGGGKDDDNEDDNDFEGSPDASFNTLRPGQVEMEFRGEVRPKSPKKRASDAAAKYCPARQRGSIDCLGRARWQNCPRGFGSG